MDTHILMILKERQSLYNLLVMSFDHVSFVSKPQGSAQRSGDFSHPRGSRGRPQCFALAAGACACSVEACDNMEPEKTPVKGCSSPRRETERERERERERQRDVCVCSLQRAPFQVPC